LGGFFWVGVFYNNPDYHADKVCYITQSSEMTYNFLLDFFNFCCFDL